jgi:hypothetical protein
MEPDDANFASSVVAPAPRLTVQANFAEHHVTVLNDTTVLSGSDPDQAPPSGVVQRARRFVFDVLEIRGPNEGRGS